jgi:hypothetical protein
MLAEWEDPKLHASFDMTYGWELYHLMNDVASGKKGTSTIAPFLAVQDSLYGTTAYRMNFTSNHDENSWNGTEFERMGENHLPAYVLSATIRNSMPLLYTGQEMGLRKRLRFFEKDTINWVGSPLTEFYRAMFALKHSQAALGNGPWGGDQQVLTTNGSDRVFAFTRARGGNAVAVFVNFDSTAASVTYQSMRETGEYTDWFAKTTITLASSGIVDIPGHGYRILVRSAASSTTPTP